MFSLKDKVAIITGSKGGVGKAIEKGFKKAGAITFGFDTKKGTDITKYSFMERQFNWINSEAGHIDILVNCAGITYRDRKSETFDLEEWDKTLEVNLTAPFKLCQLAFPHMKRNGGSIINITSIWCDIVLHNNPAYGASKGGLQVMSKALALDWGKYNIRVNNLGLGFIKTGMTKGTCDNDEALTKRISRIPLGRAGEPEDVVETAIFLASDASRYITGADIYVDGGWKVNGT